MIGPMLCSVCGLNTNSLCGHCGCFAFCDKACQIKAWKDWHKTHCKLLRKLCDFCTEKTKLSVQSPPSPVSPTLLLETVDAKDMTFSVLKTILVKLEGCDGKEDDRPGHARRVLKNVWDFSRDIVVKHSKTGRDKYAPYSHEALCGVLKRRLPPTTMVIDKTEEFERLHPDRVIAFFNALTTRQRKDNTSRTEIVIILRTPQNDANFDQVEVTGLPVHVLNKFVPTDEMEVLPFIREKEKIRRHFDYDVIMNVCVCMICGEDITWLEPDYDLEQIGRLGYNLVFPANCPICLEPINNEIDTNTLYCGHTIHIPCLQDIKICPICRTPINM